MHKDVRAWIKTVDNIIVTVVINETRDGYQLNILASAYGKRALKKPEGKVPQEVEKLRTATSDFDTLNLTPIADIVNAASKAVDENGKPKVMQHGSPNAFNTFHQ